MTKPVTVQVYDMVGGPLCVAVDDGQRVYDKIAPLLHRRVPVVLSFDRVDTMIPAFLNAAVGQLYGEFSYERVDALVAAVELSADDEEIWRHVIDNAKSYYRNPEDFDRAWREELGDEEYDEE